MNTSKFNIRCNLIIKFCSFLTIVSALVLFVSCDNKKQDLSITIKNGDGIEITGDTVAVSINTVNQTLIEVVSLSTTPRYLRQIDQGDIESLKGHKDYELISHGINTDGSNFQNVVITTSFSDSLMNVGSIVKISARVKTDMVESVIYKVTQ